MTNREIFVQILHEVTNQPKSEIGDLVEQCKKLFGAANWETELTENEAQELLSKLRSEKAGILAWLVKGGLMANQGQQGTA